VIDVHAHVVLEAVVGAAGRYGPWIEEAPDGRPRFRVGSYVLDGVRYRGTPYTDPELRVRRMDEHGIAHQVLTPNPLLWFHHVPADVAVAYCRTHNDAMAALAATHPDRLTGTAHLPVQDPAAAAAELNRSVALGLRGAAFGTDFGFPIDDERLDPVWAEAQRLAVPVFLHPAPPGIDGPPDDRRTRHGFGLHGGFAAEETLTVWNLLAGGVLERFPALDVVVSHGGGATALLLDRWRHAAATRPEAGTDAAGLERGLARLWFDTHVGGAASLAALVSAVGTDRLLLGTNFCGWDDHGPRSHGLPAERLAANARRLFPHLG
jgi:aminocarboxymuconate-semialdehyde decarboxylase